MTDRRRLEERYGIALRDLAELDEQVEAGEIDRATAEGLRANYQAELNEVMAQLDDLSPDQQRLSPTDAGPPETAPKSRSARRAIIGSVLVIAALSVAIFLAAGDIDPEPVPTTAGGTNPSGLAVDPSTVSNEQLEEVVAQNPNINAMRLALADRYFQEEDYSKALEHYLFIAENNPAPAEEGRALSRIGWMAYVTGQPETAEQYLQTSLTADPTNDEAKLFLGFVLLYGLNNADAAIPWLEEVAEVPTLSPGILGQVEAALEEARSGGDG